MTKRGLAAKLVGWCAASGLVAVVAAGCGADDAAPGVDAGSRVDLGPVDEGPGVDLGLRCAPRVSGDTRWAQYPMSGTAGHPRSYEFTGTTGAETVIDCVTGLEWQRDVPLSTYTQAEAIAYCDGLTLAGDPDWRLPSRIELVTLVDYSVVPTGWGATIDTVAFPGTPGEQFWSASSVASSPAEGWYVYFNYGITVYQDATNNGRARCVRGMAGVGATTGAPPGHFTDLGDGTVGDNLTGLVWQQGFSASILSQAASVTYCSTLAVPSGGAWRLPTVAELQTLVDETVSSPSIDTAYFPSTPAEIFWSASSAAGYPSIAWFVYFDDGIANYNVASGTYRARCVR